MRPQVLKPSPKKEILSKTALKAGSITKNIKQKVVSPKKVKKSAEKQLPRGSKKGVPKNDNTTKNQDKPSAEDEKNAVSDDAKPETSKISLPESSTKKIKKTPKEKKVLPKTVTSNNGKKLASKKLPVLKIDSKAPKKKKSQKSAKTNYKINPDVKKVAPKFSKAKTIIKKGCAFNKKKKIINIGQKPDENEKQYDEKIYKEVSNDSKNSQVVVDNVINTKDDKKTNTKSEENFVINSSSCDSSTHSSATSNTSLTNKPKTPKVDVERPPKFFTSNRSPRTVDIDIKCFKNSKGNLSMSERFLSMKCETKTDEKTKEKSTLNSLVSQGSEIDVYTFTEKVDSPKNILSDFRSPINRNVGRVRPIARVKGTIIDKKIETDKKKYSMHKPIEEVVQQLKANKRTEELNASKNQASDNESNGNSNQNTDKEQPKSIVSKSYKMVARKSSITGNPFSPVKFSEDDSTLSNGSSVSEVKKSSIKSKKQINKCSISDDELDNSKFSFNTKTYESSDESVGESNDDNDTKESSESDGNKNEKARSKKYKRITDIVKKSKSKELRELSKDSLIDLKDESFLLGNEKPSKRRLKLLSMWMGPKKHRMASLNAIAKVHCLYENESRTHVELGLMKTVDRQIIPSTSKGVTPRKKEIKVKNTAKHESTSDSEYENKKGRKAESSESSDETPPQRSLRGVPGIRSAGKYWDPKSSTSSSEDSELELKKKPASSEKKKIAVKTPAKSDSEKPPSKMKKTAGVPVKKKRNRTEVIMDLKDMVVQKRMASLNATAILAASYEKRSPKSNKDETTSDSCSDESYCQKSKNGLSSGVKSEVKNEDTKNEKEDTPGTDTKDAKQKVEVIVNQDTDVTITGVYSTHHHEGFCTVSGMQYRISSTSHTQTTATANCEKEACSREEGAKYTPLSALSTMQPPAEPTHPHTHPVPELGGLTRRAAGCSSAFSAPTSAAHHDPPGYYQPAGPMIKESAADAERALARYHPPPHYHPPHPPVLQQYGPYYPAELCYGRYYRPPGPYHLPPPQPDAQMVGVGSEPYPPPQYYGTPPCYQHSPQRIPYVEYRGCPCPLNACPKNVLIGPATGKAPTGGGPDVPSALTPPGAAFRLKARACVDAVADTHGSGKDPPLGHQLPSGANAPIPCPLPAIGGASPKRELYDVRENLRLAGDIPGPAEALGPPSPARGSAGACAPQPPPIAPRRARLGKEMARRSLVGDDTGLLLSAPMPPMQHNEPDDDVLAISPPICVPIDLSSSDERSTPMIDVKKENEGPLYSPPRKPDAQALKEHNCSTALSDGSENTDPSKAVKRRYSKSNLEIAMKDVQLQDGCKTNGIGEHVKLQKRRKVSSDLTDIVRIETITKEPKKKTPHKVRKVIKSPTIEKKPVKRKLEDSSNMSLTKKVFIESPINDDPRLINVAALPEELMATIPKTKSALLLDNLIRKNSVDRADSKGYSSDKELNPADLFLSPKDNTTQISSKKVFNINNNVVEKSVPANGVRPNTIAAVSQLLGSKLSSKNACKLEKVDSKITHNSKAVLKAPTEKPCLKEDSKAITSIKKQYIEFQSDNQLKSFHNVKKNCKVIERISLPNKTMEEIIVGTTKNPKPAVTTQSQNVLSNDKSIDESQRNISSVKTPNVDEKKAVTNEAESYDKSIERLKLESKEKRHKANGEMKGKTEKVAKLLVSKKPAIKTDVATLLVEDACASPTPSVRKAGRRSRRRRSGVLGTRRAKRTLKHCVEMLDLEPRAPPRWSNGWKWDGKPYESKVYLDNNTRLNRSVWCWLSMTHDSGDRVARGDCVLLRPSSARAQPFVARIASLWEHPDDGEMTVSLVWYYRPEHTELGRQPGDAPDEVFASRHRDINSVACIEDKCYVLTYNEYCRYRKRLKAAEEGIRIVPSIVPPMPASEINSTVVTNDSKLPPTISPELVFYCRNIYDCRSKKIQVPNK